MSKFTLKCDNEGIVNTLEFEAEYLPTVLENIEVFLMGCGYHAPYGSLHITTDDDIVIENKVGNAQN